MWSKKIKGLAEAKGLSSALNGMNYMPNKYEDPDDMKSTTDEEKLAVKAMKKKFLALVHLYQEVYTSKCAGYIAKACSENPPEVIAHIA